METSQTDLKKIGNTFCSRLQKEFLTCTICMQAYENPKVLGCNHTFCRKCLAVYIPLNVKADGTEQGFDCPLCRRFIPAPEPMSPADKWVDGLQNNFVFLSMQDMIAQTTETHNNSPYPVSAQWPKEDIEPQWTKRTLNLICNEHDKELDYYCDSHDAILCNDCVIVHHRFCPLITKCKDASKELINAVPELSESALNHSEIVKGLKKEVGIQLSRLSESRLSIQQDIKSSKEELVRKLDELERKMLDDLETVYKERKEIFDERMFQCDMIQCSTSEAIEILPNLNQCKPNEIVKQIVDRKSANLAEDLLFKEICAKTRENELRCDMNKSLRNFLMSTTKLGDLNIISAPLKIPTEASMYTSQKADVNLNDAALKSFTVEENMNVKTPTDKRHCWITGVTYLEDGRMFLVDRNNKKGKLFSENLELLSEVKIGPNCYDATATGANEVAATLTVKQRVKFIAIEANNLKTLEREIETKQLCYGIVHGLGKLFVCCVRKHSLPDCVKVFNEDDVLISQICSDSNGTPLFTSLNSAYISICPKESLISVIDQRSDRHAIVSFLLNGEIKSRILLPNWSDEVRGLGFYGKSVIVALQNRNLCILACPLIKDGTVTEMSSEKSLLYSCAMSVSSKMDKIAVSQVYPYYNCNDNNFVRILSPTF